MGEIKIRKCVIIFFTCLINFILSKGIVYAAPPAAIQSFSCTSGATSTIWPRNTFSYNCTVSLKNLVSGNTYKVGAYSSSYITTKAQGNGGSIDFRTPEYRYTIVGPAQSGVPVNITTDNAGATTTIVKNGITGVSTDSFSFTVYYTTYEADYGDTNYEQNITISLYQSDNNNLATKSSTLAFTIANKQYISISSAPSITLPIAFSLGQYYDSNTFTINVKANNTWALRAMLPAALNDGYGSTIPIGSNYVTSSGSGFLTYNRVNFAAANTYYTFATNNAGVYITGTSDNINLSGIDVITKHTLLTTDLFNSGAYAQATDYRVVSP